MSRGHRRWRIRMLGPLRDSTSPVGARPRDLGGIKPRQLLEILAPRAWSRSPEGPHRGRPLGSAAPALRRPQADRDLSCRCCAGSISVRQVIGTEPARSRISRRSCSRSTWTSSFLPRDGRMSRGTRGGPRFTALLDLGSDSLSPMSLTPIGSRTAPAPSVRRTQAPGSTSPTSSTLGGLTEAVSVAEDILSPPEPTNERAAAAWRSPAAAPRRHGSASRIYSAVVRRLARTPSWGGVRSARTPAVRHAVLRGAASAPTCPNHVGCTSSAVASPTQVVEQQPHRPRFVPSFRVPPVPRRHLDGSRRAAFLAASPALARLILFDSADQSLRCRCLTWSAAAAPRRSLSACWRTPSRVAADRVVQGVGEDGHGVVCSFRAAHRTGFVD